MGPSFVRLLSLTAVLIFFAAGCDDDPTQPVQETGPTDVAFLLAVDVSDGAGYVDGPVGWAIRRGAEVFAAGAVAPSQVGASILDTTFTLQLAPGDYFVEWQDRIQNSGGLRYRSSPVARVHEFRVPAGDTLEIRTPYTTTTGALQVRVDGFPADGRVRWALLTPDGECVRCFRPLDGGGPLQLDLLEAGQYTVWWMHEEWYNKGPFVYYFSPADSLQSIEIAAEPHPLDLSMDYQQVSGALRVHVAGLPAGTTTFMGLIMREPCNGCRASGRTVEPTPEGQPVSYVDIGRWAVFWDPVTVDGTTYVPAVDSAHVDVLPVTEPTEVSIEYTAS